MSKGSWKIIKEYITQNWDTNVKYSYRRKFIFKTKNFASSIKLKLNKKDRKEGKKIKKRKTRDNKLKKKDNLKKKRNNFFS